MNNCANNNCGNNKPCCSGNNTAACEREFLPEVMTVTMSYTPFQLDLSHFTPEEALCKGTLFTELNKPFRGRCTS